MHIKRMTVNEHKMKRLEYLHLGKHKGIGYVDLSVWLAQLIKALAASTNVSSSVQKVRVSCPNRQA